MKMSPQGIKASNSPGLCPVEGQNSFVTRQLAFPSVNQYKTTVQKSAFIWFILKAISK